MTNKKPHDGSFLINLQHTDPYYFRHSNVQRLQILANFLASPAVPDEKFNLNHWRKRTTTKNCSTADNWAVTSYDLEHECGTVACAMGWACTLPEFKQVGLLYNMSIGQVEFGEVHGTLAAAEFFKIPHSIACFLFTPEYYDPSKLITKDIVVERINILIAHLNSVQPYVEPQK